MGRCLIKVNLLGSIVSPLGANDRAENSISRIGQSSIIVSMEVLKRWLGGLQNAYIRQGCLDDWMRICRYVIAECNNYFQWFYSRRLTISRLGHSSWPLCIRDGHKGMIMLYSAVWFDPRPRTFGNINLGFDNMRVGGQEVIAQQQGELLRTWDAKLLGQDVNRVLLRVRGDKIRVVTCVWIVGECKGKFIKYILQRLIHEYKCIFLL